MLEQDRNATLGAEKGGEKRAVYVPPKVEAMPLDEIVKSGITQSSDGLGPGKT